MKTNLFAAGAFALALAMPLGAHAQQGPPAASRGYSQKAMPSEAKLQHRWAKRFGNLNLSSDQQQRIQSLIHQYAQSHPEGSARDPEANRALRQQIMGQLNSDQQNQYRQMRRAHRAQMRERQGGMQNGDEQGAPDQRYQQGPGQQQQYQQGPPPGQYPQGPPPDQSQQGPPQGQYPQGPPPDQSQQGPPPDSQGPPPA